MAAVYGVSHMIFSRRMALPLCVALMLLLLVPQMNNALPSIPTPNGEGVDNFEDVLEEGDLPEGAGYGEQPLPEGQRAAGDPSLPTSLNVGRVVYITDDENRTYRRLGVSSSIPRGITWKESFLAPALVDVSVGGPVGTPWGVSNQGVIGGRLPYFKNILTGLWYRTGLLSDSLLSDLGMVQISIGGPYGMIFGVSYSGNVYYRFAASPTSPGLSWAPVVSFTNRFSQVSVGGGYGDLFGLGVLSSSTGDRFVYFRKGITPTNKVGMSWERVGTYIHFISAPALPDHLKPTALSIRRDLSPLRQVLTWKIVLAKSTSQDGSVSRTLASAVASRPKTSTTSTMSTMSTTCSIRNRMCRSPRSFLFFGR